MAEEPRSSEEAFMSLAGEQSISAQVVLPSASGRIIDGATIITSENIQDFMPSPELAARAAAAFAAEGFDVGVTVGVGFSISAPAETFEQLFQTPLRQNEQGGIVAAGEDGSGTYELPLRGLPESLASLVVAVTFAPPPDFGPTEFSEP
jgi:hypothetical protein